MIEKGIQIEYILSMNEFAILANRCGIQRIFSFLDNQSEPLKKETFIKTLHQLTRKKIINVTDGGIQVEEPYRSYFELIRTAKEAITIDTDKSNYPGKCCYISDEKTILVTEASATREDALRVYEIEKSKFVNRLEEEGYLTYGESEVDYRKKDEKRILTQIQWWDITKETLIREVHFCLENTQCFIEQGIGKQMASTEYNVRILKKLIQEMVGGEDDDSNGLICSIIK
ncbi:hypothetical protein [Anaerosporobacter sp.]